MTDGDDGITADDLLDTLASADALETFLRLPQEDQDRFALWIGKSKDEESHWRRINALALAIRLGPLGPERDHATAEPG